ncbi:hypothetical protein C8R46DRAFT_1177069 [Mycena filopes]|nr:hypothetical protein C8R46DRAFT_1177069 [Mycena filopes]
MDLTNWRGLLISNFLANSPMSWLNFNLVPYIARLRILPDTQVATQQGVQTRDLMSALASVKCWARRRKQTVYGCVRDQMKGFDYLSPQGMYDAVEAYGLPASISVLDRAAQTETKCYIRTAYGTTDPITISGLTKQGGSLSPLKSTLTTSLGHHYLNDLNSTDPDDLVITSSRHVDCHLPDDGLSVRLNMVEATDDSHIFALSIPTLRRNVLAMERFQYAYGFLRAKIDDPQARFVELKSFIEDFTFPKFIRRPPITLIRKIVKQNIVSRARALLSLQPIKHVDALELDTKIKMKIHMETGMPFAPNTDYHGLDFPSIARINDSIAIDGLHRDLNHPIPSYRSIALITLADWTCDINTCIYPLDGPGLARDFTHHSNKIPQAWIIAQKAMRTATPPISLKRTDSSEILTGSGSVVHALNLLSHHRPAQPIPDGHARRSMRAKGLLKLSDFGSWQCQFDDGSMLPAAAGVLDPKSVTAALVGPTSLVLKIDGRNISILQGELIGLIMGLILSPSDDPNAILYTDHLNSVRLIDDSRTNPLKIVYTRGHTDEISTASRLNFEADHFASSAQRVHSNLFSAPVPTFFMDDYTFYTDVDGWIESNIRSFFDKSTIRTSSIDAGIAHQRMSLSLYDGIPPPEWSYTHAYSAYSAIVQLYARSGQLPTADVLQTRGKRDSSLCRLGCDEIEDMHHIFVACPRYEDWRAKAAADLLQRARHIPKVDPLIPPSPTLPPLARSRLAHTFAADWHTAAIRLAGRIWGDWQRQMSLKTQTRARTRS